MVTRSDVTRLKRATSRISDEAVRVLEDVFRSLDLSDAAGSRDVLVEVMPALSDTFGEMSAAATAEWYEALRAVEVGGDYYARAGGLTWPGRAEGSARWASQWLWSDFPEDALHQLRGALQRHVTYASRSTVARNAYLDPAQPRWAHVTTGAKPCAFCTVMASRGWVYTTPEKAALHSQFHDNCKCMIVPSWDAAKTHIAGYDPDRDYALYLEARTAGEPGEPLSKTVSRMQRMNPELFGT